MTTETLLTHLRWRKPELSERFGVVKLTLFGSYARGEQGPESDIDFLVELAPGKRNLLNILSLREYLEADLETDADVFTPGCLRSKIRENVLAEALDVF